MTPNQVDAELNALKWTYGDKDTMPPDFQEIENRIKELEKQREAK